MLYYYKNYDFLVLRGCYVNALQHLLVPIPYSCMPDVGSCQRVLHLVYYNRSRSRLHERSLQLRHQRGTQLHGHVIGGVVPHASQVLES